MTSAVTRSTVLLNLAFAGVSCALLARGVLIIKLAPDPVAAVSDQDAPPTPRSRGAVAPHTVAFPALAPEKPEDLLPPAPPDETKGGETGGPLVPLDADVVGIVYSTEPTRSLTSIVVGGEHDVYSVNPCVPGSLAACDAVAPGYTLVGIMRDRVMVRHQASGKDQEILLVGEGKPKAPVVAEAAAAPAPAKGKGSAVSQMMDNVKQTGPNSFEAPAGMREEVLGRLTEVAMEGRWMPYFDGGRIVGFKLAAMAPNSAFEKIGLQTGDVIRSVNGLDISSPDKILEAFNKLREARDISVDLQRGDSKRTTKQTMNYKIN